LNILSSGRREIPRLSAGFRGIHRFPHTLARRNELAAVIEISTSYTGGLLA